MNEVATAPQRCAPLPHDRIRAGPQICQATHEVRRSGGGPVTFLFERRASLS